MKIFHDWEFLEDGQRIYPISVGMVAEDGRELYLVNAEMPLAMIMDRPWLVENVVPHLPMARDVHGGAIGLDYVHTIVRPLSVIRELVLEFVRATPDPELWAWYGAFDHVTLAWLFGPMVAMPPDIPWFTNDIRTLAMLTNREVRATEPKHRGREHHALDDARHDRELFGYYRDHVDLDLLR